MNWFGTHQLGEGEASFLSAYSVQRNVKGFISPAVLERY